MAHRLQMMGNPRYKNGFKLTLHPDLLELPLKWHRPRMIFVNSMSDLYHEDIPKEFILKVFEVMNKAHWHTFQILTKRVERLVEIAPRVHWTPNIWQGVTIENQDVAYRINFIRQIPATVRFLSCEPLIGPLYKIDLTGIHWVIVGGESGPKARPMSPEWVRTIRDLCTISNVPFFFKQWGGVQKHRTGRILDGHIWNQYPQIAHAY
jgi:protein gp37